MRVWLASQLQARRCQAPKACDDNGAQLNWLGLSTGIQILNGYKLPTEWNLVLEDKSIKEIINYRARRVVCSSCQPCEDLDIWDFEIVDPA